MAVTDVPKAPSPWRAPFHLLFLFLLAAGLVTGVLGLLESDRDGLLTREYLDTAWANVQEGFGLPPQRGPWLLVVGAALAILGLLFEVLVFLPATAGHRPFRYLLMVLLLLLGMAGVTTGAFVALVHLGGFHPSALPFARSLER